MNELFSSLRIDYKSDFTGIYHNETQMTLGLYFRKKFSYSVAYSRYIKKWGELDPDIRKQFGLYYRFFGVFMENGKWIKIIKKPHLALGMYFLRFIVGLLFLLRRLIR